MLTSSQRLRPLAYSKAHVILIGYAVDTPDSLENVTNKVKIACDFEGLELMSC